MNKYPKLYSTTFLSAILLVLSLQSALGQTWKELYRKGREAQTYPADYKKAIKYHTLAKAKAKKGTIQYMKSLLGLTASYRHNKNKLQAMKSGNELMLILYDIIKTRSLNDDEGRCYSSVTREMTWLYKNDARQDKLFEIYDKFFAFYKDHFWEYNRGYWSLLRTKAAVLGYTSSIRLYKDALPIFALKLGTHHADYRLLIVEIAKSYRSIGATPNANQYDAKVSALFNWLRAKPKEALAFAEKNFGKRDQLYAASLSNLGHQTYKNKQYNQAIAYYKQAIQVYESIKGLEHEKYALAYRGLAKAYAAQKKYDLFDKYYQKTIDLYKKNSSPKYATGTYSTLQELLKEAAEMHKVFGDDLIKENKLTLAEVYYKKSLANFTSEKDKKDVKEAIIVLSEIKQNQKTEKGVISELVYNLKKHQNTKEYKTNNTKQFHQHIFNALADNDYLRAVFWAKQFKQVALDNFGKNSVTYANALYNLANAYSFSQQYQSALDHYEEVLPLIIKFDGKNSQAHVNTLLNIGSMNIRLKKRERALVVFQQLSLIYKNSTTKQNKVYYDQLSTYIKDILSISLENPKLSGKESWSELQSRGNFAFSVKDYNNAAFFYQKSRNAAKKLFKKTDENYVNILHSLALTTYLSGTKKQAINLYEELDELMQKAYGNDSIIYLRYLISLANVYSIGGSWKKAETTLLKSYNICKNKEQTGLTLHYIEQVKQNIIKFYIQQKELKKLASFQNGIINDYRSSIKDIPLFNKKLYKLGIKYEKNVLYLLAEKYLQESVKAYKKMPSEQLMYAKSLHHLANVYRDQGFFYKASQTYEKAKKYYKKKHNIERENDTRIMKLAYALFLADYAQLFILQGLLEKSEALFGRALTITHKFLKHDFKNNSLYAQLFSKIGYLKYQRKDYINAEILINQSLAIVPTEISLMYLADIYTIQHRYTKAADFYNVLLQSSNKKDPFHQALLLNKLGSLYLAQGKYSEAEKNIKEAIALIEKTVGKSSNEYAYYVNNLAYVYYKQGALAKAEQLFTEGVNSVLTLIQQNFSSLDDQSYQTFLHSLTPYIERYEQYVITYVAQNPAKKDLYTQLFNLRLATKSQRLNAKKKLQTFAATTSNATFTKAYKNYVDLRAKIATYLKLSILEQERRGINVLNDTRRLQQIEISLFKQAGIEFNFANQVNLAAIQSKLKPKEAAIELIKLDASNSSKAATQYVFIVVTPKTTTPEVVVFKEGKQLDNEYISTYRSKIQSKGVDMDSYARFWQPVAMLLKNYKVKKAFFSPDGVYHKLNLNTLYNPEKKRYVEDEVELQVVTNLIDLMNDSKTPTKDGKKATVELFGRPNYNLSLADMVKAQNNLKTKQNNESIESQYTTVSKKDYQSGKRALRSGWSDLPGTEEEIKAIAKVLQKKGRNLQVRTRLQDEALERALKNIRSPKILHIATHGFFVEKFKAPTKVKKEEVVFDNFSRGGSQAAFTMQRAKITNNTPMLRSGIVLAGVSSYEKAKDIPRIEDDFLEDGILTAYEASALDLQNTDLVTLSACETGLGEIENGEGVYGLQRAFMVAGAKSLLMSLWKVDDTATQLLMSRFYQEWIGKGKSKRAAFRAAQTYLRNYKKAGKKIYEAPYYWGAFVMVGE